MSLEKFQKHLNKPITVKIRGDDFEFKPLNSEQFLVFADIGNKINESKKKYEDEYFEKFGKKPESNNMNQLDNDIMKSMIDLFADIVVNSYPDVDLETAKNFVITTISEFQEIVPKLMPTNGLDESKNSALQQIKALQKGE